MAGFGKLYTAHALFQIGNNPLLRVLSTLKYVTTWSQTYMAAFRIDHIILSKMQVKAQIFPSEITSAVGIF